jgi:glutamate racemase
MSPIVFIDSGVGGLPYLFQLNTQMPQIPTVYIADHDNFPYGIKNPEKLQELLLEVVKEAEEQWNPQIIVLACNTASVVALEFLRQNVPHITFVGTVPAVKPAASMSKTKSIGILATGRTSEDPYLISLIGKYANEYKVQITPVDELVELIESGDYQDERKLEELMGPIAQLYRDAEVDQVVLGCTHFIHAKTELTKIFSQRVTLVDSRDGVVNRILSLYCAGLDEKRDKKNMIIPVLYYRSNSELHGIYSNFTQNGVMQLFKKEDLRVPLG